MHNVETSPTPTPLAAIPVFYDPRMLADAHSYSPSAAKPRAVVESWQRFAPQVTLCEVVAATREQLCLAHAPGYIDGVLEGRVPNGFGNRLPAVAHSLVWTTGAMLSAAREALANRLVAVAPVSGFHHARHTAAAGFCTFNGLVVTAQALHEEGRVDRVGVLDFDLHYGDGTEQILGQLKLDYIAHYTAGAEYSSETQSDRFLAAIPDLVRRFTRCDLLLYQAGADPHVDDPMGGWLTDAQLAERDRLVFETCARLALPVAWNLAGGYQQPLRKVLDIHDATMRACIDVFCQASATGLEDRSNPDADKRRERRVPSALAEEELRRRYEELGEFEDWAGERTFVSRCWSFESMLSRGPLCAELLREEIATCERMEPGSGARALAPNPALGRLLLQAWPAAVRRGPGAEMGESEPD